MVKEIAKQAQIQLCRESYIDYVQHVHKGLWYPGKHLRYICDKVTDLINGNLKTTAGNKARILIISMPPQHGKSQCITETLPSWYMGKYPARRQIVVSYNTDFARRFGRRNIAKIDEYGKDLFGLELSKRTDDEIEVSGNIGTLICRGIMSGVTGNPGDLIIIDDPIKNREEADSETYREKMWEEYLNSIKTRLSANGVIIVIQTRWHMDDLAGRIIEHESNKTVVINFPCEAEEDDLLGRQPGEPLFPEIGKDKEWLEDFKQVYMTQSGSRAWLALFQGRPNAVEGNMFKTSWWKYYDVLPDSFDRMCLSWDCSFKDSDTSDYVVGQVWGMVGIDCYLIDQVRARMDFPSTLNAVKNMQQRYPKATRVFIEDKANGSAIIAMIKDKISGVIPVEPEGGKLSRASAISPHVESGHVFLPKHAAFLNEFIDECSAFPTGKHDDQVDSMTQAINRMMYYRNIERVEIKYKEGGTYSRGELKIKGFNDSQINMMVRNGKVKLIGK